MTDPKKEAVEHPAHYGGADDPFEARKVIRAWGLGFNLGNAAKYICRAGKKDPLEQDLAKAVFYLQDEIAFLTGDDSPEDMAAGGPTVADANEAIRLAAGQGHRHEGVTDQDTSRITCVVHGNPVTVEFPNSDRQIKVQTLDGKTKGVKEGIQIALTLGDICTAALMAAGVSGSFDSYEFKDQHGKPLNPKMPAAHYMRIGSIWITKPIGHGG